MLKAAELGQFGRTNPQNPDSTLPGELRAIYNALTAGPQINPLSQTT